MQPVSIQVVMTPDGKVHVQANTGNEILMLGLLAKAAHMLTGQKADGPPAPKIEVAPAGFIDRVCG